MTETDPPTKFAGGDRPDETHVFVAPDGAPGAASLPTSAVSERYELKGEIARGGIGIVFAARDRVLNREVAVKVLREDQRDNPETGRRFLEEARITGQLQHPGIPPVHDLGTLPDGRLFIAMKLIQGQTLAARLRAEPPDPPGLLNIFQQIAQTVAFAHSHNVIHRDLKPANVMVGAFGEVQVMDWGLAKILTAASTVPTNRVRETPAASIEPMLELDSGRDPSSATQAGSVLGTPAYMAPEQAQGLTEETDRRSDVFALGSILCEILTGDPPYTGSWAVVRARAVTAQLGPAFARLDECGADREMIALAKKCLSPEPDDRPADAGAVAAMVAAHRAGVADRLRRVEVERAEAGVREAERHKRRRVQLALAAAALLLVFGSGAVAWWQDREATGRRIEAARVEAAELAARERDEALTREAVMAAITEAEVALRADDLATAAAALARGTTRLGDTGPDDLRTRLAALARDAEMVEALDILTDAQRAGRRGRLARGTELPKDYAEVFHRYGLDLRTGDPDELAERVNRSPIRAHLLVGLDAALGRYAFSSFSVPAILPPLLQRLDGDPTRTRVRNAVLAREGWRVLSLVRELDAAALTPGFAALIGQQYDLPDADRLRVLAAASERHPGDFRLHELLCQLHLNSGPPGSGEPLPAALAAAHTHARVLVSLRPASPDGYRLLGRVHRRAGRLDDAIATFQKAAELTPAEDEAASLRSQIGNFIRVRSGPDAALRYFQAEVARTPADAYAHANLGRALQADRNFDGAIACFRKATELRPTEGGFYTATARSLLAKGDRDGAVDAYRLAAERGRPRMWSHIQGLSQVLVAREEYRAAVRVQEQVMSDFPAAARVADTHIRYDGACAAALAGTHGGKEPAPRTEWPQLRSKALLWLREDYTAWRTELALDPARHRRDVYAHTRRVLADPHFARVRHPLYLAALPQEEAAEWLTFWNDLRLLRDAAEIPVAPMPRAK